MLCVSKCCCFLQVSGCADGSIHLWDVPAQRCLRKLVGHTGEQGAACSRLPPTVHDCLLC